MRQRKEKATEKFSCVKERKNCLKSVMCALKKEKTADKVSRLNKNTADKVSCVKNIHSREIRLLTKCHALYNYILQTDNKNT